MIKDYFQKLDKVLKKYAFKPKNMYNMDEKGFLLGYNNRAKVIVRHRRQMPTETQDRSREWITVVECASAGQFMLPPMIIYRGKGIYRGWTSTVDDAGPPLHIATKDSPRTTLNWSGYIALTLGLAYVLQVHPGFYSWMATTPTTPSPFNLCAM